MAFIEFTNDTALFVTSGSCLGILLFIAVCHLYNSTRR